MSRLEYDLTGRKVEVAICKVYDRYENRSITIIIKKHKNGNIDIMGME